MASKLPGVVGSITLWEMYQQHPFLDCSATHQFPRTKPATDSHRRRPSANPDATREGQVVASLRFGKVSPGFIL